MRAMRGELCLAQRVAREEDDECQRECQRKDAIVRSIGAEFENRARENDDDDDDDDDDDEERW